MKIENFKLKIVLSSILIIASFLRFYNLLFDAPHFFNPDERNMANAIVQFRIPPSLKEWPECLWAEVSGIKYQAFVPSSGRGISGEETQRPMTNDQRPDCNLHPHFFAYGQFPLYLSFFSDQLATRFISAPSPIHYSSAIFWLRFWSALSSVGTVFITYLITAVLVRPTTKDHRRMTLFPLLAALFTTFTPGLIQSAHFGTTESLLTFFLTTSAYLSLRLIPPPSSVTTISLLALVCGFAIGTKLTGLFCLVAPAIAAVLQLFLIVRTARHRARNTLRFFASWFICLGLTIGISVVASPYNLIDLQGFKGSVFGYEKEVATGEYKAFYTRQFENTVPILFQMEKIFPYALGLPLFIFGLSGFIFSIGSLVWQVVHTLWKELSSRKSGIRNEELGIRNPAETSMEEKSQIAQHPVEPKTHANNTNNLHPTTYNSSSLSLRAEGLQLVILIVSFLTYLIPNSILYAKWTRFVAPIFPFFAVFASLFLYHVFTVFKSTHRHVLEHWSIGTLAILSLLPGLAFFSIYLRDDVRVTATKWIYANVPDQAYILFDTGNVIDIPLSLPSEGGKEQPLPTYTSISFDFYHIEENAELLPKLLVHLENADYIFVPSRRIFANHIPREKEFPTAAAYYRHLFDGSLGFEKVEEFSSFPTLGPLQFPDEQAEETSTVFDHPVIRIYKKVRQMNVAEYRALIVRR